MCMFFFALKGSKLLLLLRISRSFELLVMDGYGCSLEFLWETSLSSTCNETTLSISVSAMGSHPALKISGGLICAPGAMPKYR